MVEPIRRPVHSRPPSFGARFLLYQRNSENLSKDRAALGQEIQKSVAELFDAALDPPARSQGLRAYRAVVPGGVGYQHDYQVAGDDYPGMRMQPNDRIRNVIIIFEMKPMSFALGRKHPGSSCIGR